MSLDAAQAHEARDGDAGNRRYRDYGVQCAGDGNSVSNKQ